MKGRPKKDQQKLFNERKELMIVLSEKGYSQIDIASIFRVPRNTVHMILKKYSASKNI